MREGILLSVSCLTANYLSTFIYIMSRYMANCLSNIVWENLKFLQSVFFSGYVCFAVPILPHSCLGVFIFFSRLRKS